MKKIVKAFFAVFWIGCASLSAQTEDIFSRHYSMKDGLSHDIVFCILQDSQGFLWMGSLNGLSKFDGQQFTTYLNNPADTNSLVENAIYSKKMWEDHQQRLWIGTYKGLDIFDLKTEKFHHLILDSLDTVKPTTREKEGIQVKAIQERKDGKVWVCTSNGMYVADPITLAVKKLNYFPQLDGSIDIRSDRMEGAFKDIAEAKDGSIWAASSNGLYHWNALTGKTTRYRHDPLDPSTISTNSINCIYIDRHERVWIGTFNSFALFNPEDQSFTHILPNRSQSEKPQGLFEIQAISENQNGQILVGSTDGLYILDLETETTELLIDDSYIWSIFKDRQGNTWVCATSGLYQIAPHSKKFKVIPRLDQTQDVLPLVYTPGYTGPDKMGVIPDEEGSAWVISYNKLKKYNLHSKILMSIELPYRPIGLYKDSKGKIWVRSRQGLGIYDPQINTFKHLSSFPEVRIHGFCEERDKYMWIGTEIGLIRYNLITAEQDIFKHDPADPQSLGNDFIEDMIMDKNGVIWICARGGVSMLIPGTQDRVPKFKNWNDSKTDLPHNHITSIIDGEDGTFWLSCGNQISHFFPKTGEFRNYDHNDGLHGNHLLDGFKSSRGKIYYGSRNKKHVVFHPDSLQDNPYIPPVEITGFSLHNHTVPIQGNFGDSLTWESPLTHSISYTNELSLAYWQNDFTLEFAALNFINSENNLYKYKLEPYEEEWIETTADNRIARYTKLSPGEYTFRVIGSNNDGIWNNEGRSLSIIIHPPWWQTWWAYTLYVILALGVLGAVYYYEAKRIKLRQRAKNLAEVDTLKTRFFTNISHEFRTPLTLILGPAKKLKARYHAPAIQDGLGIIQRNAQQLLHLVNQLLDLSKLEAGKLKLEAVKSDIVAFLKARACAFSSLAESKDIHFSIELPEEKTGAYFDRDKLEKVINNLLSNAIKFTGEGGNVTLKGTPIPMKGKEWFQIQVTDSGKGIASIELDKIFDRFYQVDATHTREQEGSGIGLALTKELVALHHGEIKVESKVAKGTTFTVLLPLGKKHLKEHEIIQELPLSIEETEDKKIEAHSSEILISHSDNNLEKEDVGKETEKPLVLIVEDHQEMRKFIRDCINNEYHVKEAENGKIGVTMAKKYLPDLILSDVMMPEKDGYELCKIVKTNELTSHIPVILLTAKADRKSKLTGLEIGADDYLAKPFDTKELQLIIRNRIEERRIMREKFSHDITLEPMHITVSSLDEQFLNKLLEDIEENIDNESFTIEALSQHMGYSHMHFYRKLKALTGQTPSQFLRTVRLKRAAELLRQKSNNIAQVAFSVGFGNVSYFNRCFKDQFGMTPTQFAAEAQVPK